MRQRLRDFTLSDYTYTRVDIVTYNGREGSIWHRRKVMRGTSVLAGMAFISDEAWSPEDWIDIRREATNMAETHQILLESGLTLTQIQAMKAWWTV